VASQWNVRLHISWCRNEPIARSHKLSAGNHFAHASAANVERLACYFLASDVVKGRATRIDVRLGSKASVWSCTSDVCFYPDNGGIADVPRVLLGASSGLMHRSKRELYSMTTSARASSVGGTSTPSIRAACKFMTNSNLVDCRTGSSAGFAPLRMVPQ
jgi:hypothetical protein